MFARRHSPGLQPARVLCLIGVDRDTIMPVTVKAHGALREQIGSSVAIEHPTTVGEAIGHMHLPDDMGLAILVNGVLAHWNTPLHDGDIIQLIPQISGG